MSPQQYLYMNIVTILTNNNPAADPSSINLLASELAGLWANLILPNLQADLSTGKISFTVPAS